MAQKIKGILERKGGKQPPNKRRLKNGSYSILLTAVVIAGAVAVNLIVSELPSQYTKIDVSEQQLTTLGNETKELAAALNQDITMYYIVQDGNCDTNVSRLLERYNDISPYITVEEKDPVMYPNFTSQYTDQEVSENSVIVTCGDAVRVVSYDSMYESEFNYSYYSYETTGFDAEGQITSAIAAVSSDNLPKLYILTGHGELDLSDSLTQLIEKENIKTESLNLVTTGQVPEDADCLLIASPTSDFSNAETQKILSYLKTGGKAIIVTDYTGREMPNLASVLEYYGVSVVDGVVIEGDSGHYVQVPYYLVPDISNTEISSDMAGGNNYILLAAAQGLQTLQDIRDGVDIKGVLTSSSSSYSKANVQNMSTYEKEADDIDGPFNLGVIITENVELTEELLAEASAAIENSETADSIGGLPLMEADAEDTKAVDGQEADALGIDAGGQEADMQEPDTELEEETIAETENVGEAETEIETGVEAEDETAETKLAVFTSSTLLDASADQMVSGGNFKLFMNTVSWICGHTTTVSVPVKSLSVNYLTLTSASSSFWSIVVIGVVPGAFLLTGLFIWLKRRKQ